MKNSTCINFCQDLHISFGESNSIFGEDLINVLSNKTNNFILDACTNLCPEQVQYEKDDFCNQLLSHPINLPPGTFIKILFPLLLYFYLMSMLDCAQLHYNTGLSNFFLFGVKEEIDEEDDNIETESIKPRTEEEENEMSGVAKRQKYLN